MWIQNYKIVDDGIWLPKEELERLRKEQRKLAKEFFNTKHMYWEHKARKEMCDDLLNLIPEQTSNKGNCHRKEMKQLTEEQAIAFGENKLYEGMTPQQIAEFQLEQDRLCMPFDVFHKAVEEALGRPVYIHEMALSRESLLKELLGERPAPTLEEIINLIPEEKRIVIQV